MRRTTSDSRNAQTALSMPSNHSATSLYCCTGLPTWLHQQQCFCSRATRPTSSVSGSAASKAATAKSLTKAHCHIEMNMQSWVFWDLLSQPHAAISPGNSVSSGHVCRCSHSGIPNSLSHAYMYRLQLHAGVGPSTAIWPVTQHVLPALCVTRHAMKLAMQILAL